MLFGFGYKNRWPSRKSLLKPPPKSIWIGCGLMLLALVLTLMGFGLKALGIWNDLASKCFMIAIGGIFLSSVVLLTKSIDDMARSDDKDRTAD
jgi:hypothetical protein